MIVDVGPATSQEFLEKTVLPDGTSIFMPIDWIALKKANEFPRKWCQDSSGFECPPIAVEDISGRPMAN
jgi:hypothetical protein